MTDPLLEKLVWRWRHRPNAQTEAAEIMQRALFAVSEWAKENHVEISMEKTEALVFSVDPRETSGKAQPNLMLLGKPVPFSKEATVLGIKRDSQVRFGAQTTAAVKKMSRRCQILQALSGKDWGPTAADVRRLYESYVRPGGLYGAGVWGSFLAETQMKKLETCNNRAARIITGLPRDSPVGPTRMEADLPPLREVIEEEAAVLYTRHCRLRDDHYLKTLAKKNIRPRLKSRGENNTRPDWRRTARNRLGDLPDNEDPRSRLWRERERRKWERYNETTEEDHFHRRATDGCHLEHDSQRTRAEEVLLMSLRVNRAHELQQTKYRYGRAESPICPFCSSGEEESAEHYLLYCETWADIREETIGNQPGPDVLQDATKNTLDYARRTGRFAALH